MDALLSIERAAQVLGISPWTVRRYISTKKIPHVKIGRRVLLEQQELQRVVQNGRVEPRVYEYRKEGQE